MFAGENSQEEIEQHVSEWIALNKKTWENWLKEARATAK
jgi:ABC-type proline/glycine betaine transport system substrate-binding protein